MSFDALQTLVGTAIVDRNFCDLLLRSPADAVRGFDLSDEERDLVCGIRAMDLQQFAAQLHWWLCCSPSEERESVDQPRYRYVELLRRAG